VIGAGVVGLATADALMRRGADVACFEKAVPGRGQSAGATRTFRHGHEDRDLVEFALLAREGWRAWEAAPRVGPRTQRPYQFTDLPLAEHAAFYLTGIDDVAGRDAYAGLLVCLHLSGLYQRRFGIDPGIIDGAKRRHRQPAEDLAHALGAFGGGHGTLAERARRVLVHPLL